MHIFINILLFKWLEHVHEYFAIIIEGIADQQ